MKRFLLLLPLVVLALCPRSADAVTVIGDLNNFDTLNDTGQVCYGFEIEIDGITSADVTYTFDWNHYGPPKIRQDLTDPANPKVFVRYESTKDAGGAWGANGSFTNTAIPTITPPQGHTCTNTSVNEGCEHFGVGYYGTPTAIKYNWLVDDHAGGLAYFGTPVPVAAPAFVYTPPAPGVAAQVVAAIPAPVVPNAQGKEFGEPSWVKVITTTAHNANDIQLQDLTSDDTNGDGLANWQNNEPDQVETEWYLLQDNNGGNPAKQELAGAADDMGDGSETVTRRYEFYRYAAALDTIDGENGEAMCDEVNPTTDPNDPNYLHGVGDHVAVTDANGDTYYVDCSAQVVVGNYIGAQMAGFNAAAPLGLIDHLQDGELSVPYTERTVVVGGDSPFVISITGGSLPAGMQIAAVDGVLSGTPTSAGAFAFTVNVTDSASVTASKSYVLKIAGGVAEACPAGTFSATGSTPCTPAPAGSYASGTGNTSATLCPAGTFSSTSGASACTPAPAGSYASGTGNTSATLCPAGTFSSTSGASACTPAPAGSYASGTGNTSATLCPAGTFSSTSGSSSCTPAPAGSYASGTGNTSATPCPPGTTSDVGASSCTSVAQLLDEAIDAAVGAGSGMATSLHQQSRNIAFAANAHAKAGALQAFINHVNAQRGKALTAAEADELIALARLL